MLYSRMVRRAMRPFATREACQRPWLAIGGHGATQIDSGTVDIDIGEPVSSSIAVVAITVSFRDNGRRRVCRIDTDQIGRARSAWFASLRASADAGGVSAAFASNGIPLALARPAAISSRIATARSADVCRDKSTNQASHTSGRSAFQRAAANGIAATQRTCIAKDSGRHRRRS